MWINSSGNNPPSDPRPYRAYPVDGEGAIEGPAIGLLAQSDEEALREAHVQLGFQRVVEVWNGTRRLTERPTN